MLYEFLGHTYAVILDEKFKGAVTLTAAGLFYETDNNISASRGELYGIADNVQQHLVQSELVGDNILIFNILSIDVKILLLGIYHSLNHIPQVMEQCRHVYNIFIQLYTSALYAAHIQNIVNKA